MRRQVLKGATVLLSAGALMALGLSPAGAETSHPEIQQTVHVTLSIRLVLLMIVYIV